MDDQAYAEAWRRAASLEDAGELVATFLEVPMSWTPTHRGPPDEEISGLVPCLAAVNRAGFVTEMSQPGEVGEGWKQRACVSGYCATDAVDRLRNLEIHSDLVVAVHRPGSVDGQPGWAGTYTEDEGACTWDGMPSGPASLTQWYREPAPLMAEALIGSWQVAVVDPHWGRNDLLWSRLLQAVTSP